MPLPGVSLITFLLVAILKPQTFQPCFGHKLNSIQPASLWRFVLKLVKRVDFLLQVWKMGKTATAVQFLVRDQRQPILVSVTYPVLEMTRRYAVDLRL